jgi:hypothetical protein
MDARRLKWIAIRDVFSGQLFRAGIAVLISCLPPAQAFAQTSPAADQTPAAPAATAPPSVATGQSRTTDLILSGEAHCGTDDTTRRECRLGDHLYVGFQNLKAWMDNNPGRASDIALVLNGQVIRGIPPLGPDNTYKYLRFDLTRLEDEQDTSKQNRLEWNALMSDLRDDNVLHVRVATGGNAPFWGPEEKVAFQVLPRYSWVALILLAALLLSFIVLARKSDILRDSPSVNGIKQSYSLARCQMAWWFFLVAASYCYLWTVLRNRESLTPGVLILTGVSAGTGLAAAVIDANKRQQRDQLAQEKDQLTASLTTLPAAISTVPAGSTAAAQLAAEQQQKSARLIEVNSDLAALPSPVGKSESFLLDILRDETGISFHRFQMMAWTIILGLVFVSSVWSDFTMPDFSVTLLGLMGISSGTYVGFKLSSSPK